MHYWRKKKWAYIYQYYFYIVYISKESEYMYCYLLQFVYIEYYMDQNQKNLSFSNWLFKRKRHKNIALSCYKTRRFGCGAVSFLLFATKNTWRGIWILHNSNNIITIWIMEYVTTNNTTSTTKTPPWWLWQKQLFGSRQKLDHCILRKTNTSLFGYVIRYIISIYYITIKCICTLQITWYYL